MTARAGHLLAIRSMNADRTGRATRGIAVATALLLAAGGCSSPAAPAAAAPAPSPVGSSAPSALKVSHGAPPPAGSVGAPSVGIKTQPAVAVGSPAEFGDVAVTATVSHVDDVQLQARAPGEIAGPGVGVTIELKNSTSAPVDLGAISVNGYYGARVPAPATSSAPSKPLSGTLAPGASREGVYAFQIPSAARSSVVVEIGYSGSADLLTVHR